MYGLVLGGGGAKGAYQIGVWKAMNELGIEVGCVAGTSVGALNGAMFAQRQYDEAYQMWSELSMEHVFDGDDELFSGIDNVFKEGLFSTGFSFFEKTYQNIKGHKGLDIAPLRDMIDNLLDEDILRKSGIDFGLVTISINDRKVLRIFADEITEGELKYYLLGSAMVPGFKQDENFGKKFIDGGVYDNFPIKMVYEKGYRKIIGVSLYQKKFRGYKDAEVIYISPSKNLGNFLYFNKTKSHENITMGYLDALKAFDKVKGFDYYFDNLLDETTSFETIETLSFDMKNKISKIVLKKELDNLRMFYEKVMPKLAKDLALKPTSSYDDIVIKCLEHILNSKDENQLEKYDFMKKAQECDIVNSDDLLNVCYLIINNINI